MEKQNLFKWKHYQPDIILLTVRWYLRYNLSFRNVVEMMEERGLSMAYTTIMRWVHQYGPELDKREITFLGAGSTVFAKKCPWRLCARSSVEGFEFALYDIDEQRLKDSENMLRNLQESLNKNIKINAYLDRKAALRMQNTLLMRSKLAAINLAR